MAKEAIFLGKNGAGALTKLLVNLVLGLNRMALAEGLSLAKRAGIDQYRILTLSSKVVICLFCHSGLDPESSVFK